MIPDRKMLDRWMEDATSKTVALCHLTAFLMTDLEGGLDEKRARRVEGDTITLSFDRDNIDATLWLMSEVWGRARDIEELLGRLHAAIADVELSCCRF